MIRINLVRGVLLASLLALTGCATTSAAGGRNVQEIRAGETRSARLSPRDPVLVDGSHYQDWIFAGTAGERIRIDMRSAEIDAFLHLRVADSNEVLVRNDDGGSGRDARIEITLPQTTRYVIRANTFDSDDVGAYTLSVTRVATPTAATAEGQSIQAGMTRSGNLSASSATLHDGSYYDLWYYDGRAGERLRIDLRSSEFDAYLSVGIEVDGEFEEIASDDDSGGGTDARVDVTLPRDGRYLIRANSLFEGETGEYRLSVERR